MSTALVVLGINIARTVVNYKFVKLFFPDKKTSKFEYFAWGLFCIVLYIVYIGFHFPTLNLSVNILFLVILTYIRARKFFKSLFVAGLVYIVDMACDVLVMIVFTQYVIGGKVNEYYGIVIVLLIFLVEQFAEILVHIERELNIPKKHWFILIIVPVISVCMIYVIVINLLTKNNRVVVAFIVISILVNNLLLLSLYNIIMNSYVREVDRKISEQQIESYENQLRIYEESEKKYNALKHDLKHHMMLIRGLVEKNNEEALEYLSELQENYQNDQEYVNCGNRDIDRIFNYMLGSAADKLRVMEVSVKIPEDIEYKLYDINIILCNLLDNAISAALDSEDKILKVNMFMEKSVLFITVENSYANKINISNGRFITTKTKGHGIGLENVKRSVEKCNGIVNIKTEKLFIVDVMLYISTKEKDPLR